MNAYIILKIINVKNFSFLINKTNECIDFCHGKYQFVNDNKLCIFNCEI